MLWERQVCRNYETRDRDCQTYCNRVSWQKRRKDVQENETAEHFGIATFVWNRSWCDYKKVSKTGRGWSHSREHCRGVCKRNNQKYLPIKQRIMSVSITENRSLTCVHGWPKSVKQKRKIMNAMPHPSKTLKWHQLKQVTGK